MDGSSGFKIKGTAFAEEHIHAHTICEKLEVCLCNIEYIPMSVSCHALLFISQVFSCQARVDLQARQKPRVDLFVMVNSKRHI